MFKSFTGKALMVAKIGGHVFVFFLFLMMVLGFPLQAVEQDEGKMSCDSCSPLREKAQTLHALHHGEDLLILPNAWDALSARIFEREGAKAIATTSAGIAATFGYPDGQLPKELLLTMVERIVRSVQVPVTVDLEAGFGDTPEEVCQTVRSILKIGAVGINIEDTDPKQPGQLFPIAVQMEKIKAIKTLAHEINVPLFVNVRTDVFWLKLFTEQERLSETMKRLQAYKEAGADGIFVPGLTDSPSIIAIAEAIQLPLNVLAGPWISDLSILKPLGVSRITIGSSGTRVCAGHLQTLTHHYLNGQYTINPNISYAELSSLFS